MEIHLIKSAQDLSVYDEWVKTHPQGTLWQSLEWKGYQEALGRETRVYAAVEGSQIIASALVIIDRTSFGLSTWDIPRGPLAAGIDNEKLKIDNLMKHIIADAKKDKCLCIYLSPLKKEIINYQLSIINSTRHEQPEATRILNLTLSDEELLNQMHQKGRYNIKVAEKNNVSVKQSTDVQSYAELAKKTAVRDRFKGASQHQYETFIESLPGSFLLLAYSNDQPIAGLMGVIWNGTGTYYYGASDYEHRAMMAPYLLQWEAIKLTQGHGCTRYDLLGVMPPGASNDHPWAGISSFKEKFGGELVTYPPEQQITLKKVAKTMLKAKRKLFG